MYNNKYSDQLLPMITPEMLSHYPDQTCEILNKMGRLAQKSSTSVEGGGEGNLEDIVQTSTSYADGGVNIVTAYLSDGTTQDFQIRNGHQGSQGDPGAPGQDATIAVGTTTTLPAGSSATVTDSGTPSAAVLNFGIPKGDTGAAGADGQDGFSPIATVTKSGDTATISITDENGTTTATVTDGADGAAATVSAGTTTTLPAGSSATVTNSGTSSAAVFDFGIPKGDKGDTGSTGPAGPGVVSGGTTGQVLTKKSGTDYDTEWTAPATYSDFTGATSSVAGAHGLVPAPTTSDPDKFLKGDGTWGTPPGTTYTAGTGIDITGSTIAVDTSTVAMQSDLPTKTSDLINDGADSTSTYVEADELATVATSGSYNDLLNKPTIPTVNDAVLTVTQNGTTAGTFTANSNTNTTIALTDTTYTEGTGIDITGNTIAVDTTQVSMKSEYTVKKSYTIDLTAQSTSNFYPVVFTRTQNMVDCEIHSEGGGSGIAYNQNVLHFQMISQGWSDLSVRKKLIVLQEGAYDSNEITIGCVGLGDHQGNNCVWLRGGIRYFFTCNVTAEAHTSSYTISDETFSVGTNYYGGTNANVTIYYTPQNINKDVALIEDVDARANLYRYTKSQYNSSANSWYYPIATLPIDNSGNSCSVIINGRIGGWTNANMAKIDLLLTNRSNYSGDNITASGSIKGPYTGALNMCNVVVYKQTDKSAIVYLKCDSYFAFDITADYYQATKAWTGNYTTSPSGTLIWSTKTTNALEFVDTEGRISKVREMYDHFTSRPASANLTATGNGGMFTFQATGSMTTAKPKADAHIIHLEWDNANGWDSQIAVRNNGSAPWVAVRAQDSGTWGNWVYLLNDEAGSVKTTNIDALAVTTAKIDDGAVTAAKLASGVVNDATLTITQNGSTLGTFTANASSNVTIDVPGTVGPKGDPGKGCPIGTILPYSGTTLPEGYLACDGTAVSRTTYSDLFSAIGTTYGSGDGSTTFNLPDLKGKVPVGQDANDTDFDALGDSGGEKTHKLVTSEMPSHQHKIRRDGSGVEVGIQGGGATGNAFAGTWSNTNIYSGSVQTENIGGNGAHNNLQPYIVINYIIKFKDLPNTVAEVKDQYSSSATDVYSANYVNNAIQSGSSNPTGAVITFAGSSAPAGYLICDGSAVSRTTYADLFTVIGTTYGTGDGSTTFNLPNLKGKVIVGQDANDTSFDTLGETGGEKTHQLVKNELPKIEARFRFHGQENGTEIYYVSGDAVATQINNKYRSGNTASGAYSQQDPGVKFGNDQAHNNLQPYIVLNYIIKT